jgi:lipopolysaccharide transport system permease protein
MSETVYSSQAELQHPSRFLAEAWRDLRHAPPVAWQLFRSNVQARHRRAWLGYLWLLLPTIGTTLVWVYVQSRQIVAVRATGLPYTVYALSGIIFWQVFSESLLSPLQQFGSNKPLITRSRVPHEALILAGLLETLFHCAIRLLILIAVVIAFGVTVDAAAVLVPLGVLALALMGLALGLLATPMGLLYDDVGRALTMMTGFWFFLTPVVYPTPARGFLRFNPVSPLLETTRQWLTASAPIRNFAAVTGATIVVLIAAWLLHRLARPHVVARLG